MSNFIEHCPSSSFIRLMQKAWYLYARLSLGNLHILPSRGLLDVFHDLKGQPTIICANHPATQDAAVLFGLSGIVAEQFAFLTAREMFGGSNSFRACWLQKLGCYSVERASADMKAFKASCHLLAKNQNKVVIFPEGEISYQNHFIREFENGPESIAISASHELKLSGLSGSIKILPLALKYRYSGDIQMHLLAVMRHVERRLGVKDEIGLLKHRIKRAFELVFTAIEKEQGGENLTQTALDNRLSLLCKNVISEVEIFTDQQSSPSLSHLDRIHLLINELTKMQYRAGQDRASWFKKTRSGFFVKLYLSRLMRLLRLLTIGEHRFDHNLTQEEAAEMLNILVQEAGAKIAVRKPDIVQIAAAEVIDVEEFIPDSLSDRRNSVQELRLELKRRISVSLSALEKASEAHMLSPASQADLLPFANP